MVVSPLVVIIKNNMCNIEREGRERERERERERILINALLLLFFTLLGFQGVARGRWRSREEWKEIQQK
jgi:hypothetical protein